MSKYYKSSITNLSLSLLLICLWQQGLGQQFLENKFTVQLVSDQFNTPVGIEIDQNGVIYIWEKSGKLWTMETNGTEANLLLDISEEVTDHGDLGLLGFAFDPNFSTTGHIYLYYSVDYHHLKYFGTPFYDPTKNDYLKATIARLARYTVTAASDIPRIKENSRKIILGKTMGSGIPIIHYAHIGGTILFGEDGTLLLSVGDCTTWEGEYVGGGPPYYNANVPQGLADGILREEEEVGAMRAQMINSYSGKILRMDPETGLGIPSNPFFDPQSPNSPASKVWALGFRNPYRMTLKKGSGSTNPEDGFPGTLCVGDVGGAYWEEYNIIRLKGENFGWPIFEAYEKHNISKLLQFNQDVINECNGEPFLFQDLIKQISKDSPNFENPCDPNDSMDKYPTFVHRNPDLVIAHITKGLGAYSWDFNDQGEVSALKLDPDSTKVISEVGDIRGNAVLGGPFYTGDKYPEDYKGDLFVSDFNNGWISRVELDDNDSIRGIYRFYDDTFTITHVTENYYDGCLYFIEYQKGISKICYDVNVGPKIVAQVYPQHGPSPLKVNLNASESKDPENEELEYFWEISDGTISNASSFSHIFEIGTIQNYKIKLSLSDQSGNTSEQEWTISVNNSPPTANIIPKPVSYSIVGNNEILFNADYSDLETQKDSLKVKWTKILHHNTHFHIEEEIFSEEAKITIPPVGCKEEVYYYRVKLEVEDEHGLTTKDEIYIYPDCGYVFADLYSFQASIAEEEVLLKWEMENEEDVQGYEVQRKGPDGEFNTIEHIDKILSNMGQYETLDTDPKNGTNFYRLKINSNQGVNVYSEIRKAFYYREGSHYIFPNPNTGEFFVHFKKLQSKVNLKVMDLNGNQVYMEELTGIGERTFHIDTKNNLSSGVYSVIFDFGDHIEFSKIVIIDD